MAETAVLTLTDFLLARIAEDEAALRLMAMGDGWYSPERYEAECEVKRRMIDRFPALGNSYGKEVQRILAMPYADHPDYRAEWRLWP